MVRSNAVLSRLSGSTPLVLSVMLIVGCSKEPAPASTPPAESGPAGATPADPAAAFQNVAHTIVRVMNADGRMQGELTVVEATLEPHAVPSQPGAAVGTIVLAYQSKGMDPTLACRITLKMENAAEFWELIPQGRTMSDFDSPLKGGSPDAFNSHVNQHTEVIREVMDDLMLKSEIANALVAPRPSTP